MKKLALFLAVSLAFIGCSEDKKAQQESAPQAQQIPPLPVSVHLVKFGKEDFFKTYSAVIKPYMEVDVISRVSGYLVKENFREGSFVKKGDVLYELQKDEYLSNVKLAQASVTKAEANFNKAQRDWDRALSLYKNGAISTEQRDNVVYAYDSAKALRDEAKASLENANLNYSYTTIKAPISGIAGISGSDEGAYINKEDKSSKLTTITAINPVFVEFSLPSGDIEKYLSNIKIGSSISALYNKTEYSGIIDYISPKVDSQTDTLLVRAKFENSKNSLIIGSFVQIKLSGFSLDNVAKIPQNALIKTQDATMVYVVKEGIAQMRSVKVAFISDATAMIESGIEEGDAVVSSNIAKLRPNSKVSITEGK